MNPERVIDGNGWECPGEWEQVLQACSLLGRNDCLSIHTRFQPRELLTRLEQNGFDGESEELAPGRWLTRIWRMLRP